MSTQERNPVSVLYYYYLPRRIEGMELSAMRQEMAEKGADPATISKVIRLIDSEERRLAEESTQASRKSQWRTAGYISAGFGLITTFVSCVVAGPGFLCVMWITLIAVGGGMVAHSYR